MSRVVKQFGLSHVTVSSSLNAIELPLLSERLNTLHHDSVATISTALDVEL